MTFSKRPSTPICSLAPELPAPERVPARDWKSHSFVRNSDHQDVDGRLAEVPLRSVHGHFVGGLLRKQVQEEPPKRHGIEIVLAKKTLNVRR